MYFAVREPGDEHKGTVKGMVGGMSEEQRRHYAQTGRLHMWP